VRVFLTHLALLLHLAVAIHKENGRQWNSGRMGGHVPVHGPTGQCRERRCLFNAGCLWFSYLIYVSVIRQMSGGKNAPEGKGIAVGSCPVGPDIWPSRVGAQTRAVRPSQRGSPISAGKFDLSNTN